MRSMGQAYQRLRTLFPGKSFTILILNIVALFLVSLLDLVGVVAILPIIQMASGADYENGYLGILHRAFGQPGREEMILVSVIILVVAFVFKGVFSLLIKWWSGGFLARQQTANAVIILENYANDTYLQHRKRSTADILRLNDANNMAYTGYVTGVLAVIGETASITLLLGMLLVVMPVQAIIATLYFGLAAYFLQNYLKEKNREIGQTVLDLNKATSSLTLNLVNGFRENKLSGMTVRNVYNFQEARLKADEANRKKTFFFDLPKYLLEIIFIVGIAIILAMMVFSDGLDAASYLVVFAGACVRILPSFVRLVGSLGAIRTSIASVELLDRENQNTLSRQDARFRQEPDIGDFAKVNKHIVPIVIQANDLSFRYPDGERYVLEQLLFTIPEKSSAALIGGSGSGKTTLIDVLLGLFEPSCGSVSFNDKDIHSNLDEWHKYLGYVPQDVFLSGKSIREEIAYGFKPDEIDEQRIIECVESAELAELVESLEEGLDTLIGERGTRLSGGQRQRLGIARALYRNPSILVLDEATSALDNKTEYKITKSINKLSQKITVIVVAHRLSTVRDVDQVLFMSDGKIVSRGTFDQVRVENSEFAELVRLGQLPE